MGRRRQKPRAWRSRGGAPVNASPGPPPSPAVDSERRLPRARIRRRLVLSWIWLLPLGALGLVGYLVYGLAADRGPMISIAFDTADGLSAEQTEVKYKAVTLGTVAHIDLADDLSHVVVQVRMNKGAASLLTDRARFWVVRPRLTGGLNALQSGIETLVSGAYVAVDPGSRGGKPRTHFKGLEKPPSTRSDEPGSVYFLQAAELRGLSEGAPIYYRDVNVGEVLSYELGNSNQQVSVRIFVRAPYDRRVTSETRFWNSSGIRIDTGGTGIRVQLQSFESLLSGGIAFRDPPGADELPQSQPETSFQLYPSKSEAEIGFDGRGIRCVSYFQSSVRGLSAGSEVSMFGKHLGSVTAVDLVRDPRAGHEGRLVVRVAYVLQPERALNVRDRGALEWDGMRARARDQLQVVLESSSILTGQKELALEYVSGSKLKALSTEGNALVLPGETRDLQGLTGSLAQIVNRIGAIPFEEIGQNADRTLASLDRTIGGPELQRAVTSLTTTLNEARQLAREARNDLGPALARLPGITQKLERAVDQAQAAFGQSGYGSDSTTQRNLERMLSQVGDAARSVRVLADYLSRHPEAVVAGRRASDP